MIGNKGHDRGVRAQRAHSPEIALGIACQIVHAAACRGLGDQALRLGHGKVKAVERTVIDIGHTVAVPHLADEIDIVLKRAQLVGIPLPEVGAGAVVAVIDVFHRIEAKAVHTQIEPVFGDREGLGAHGGAVKVQLRHVAGEVALVIIIRPVDLPEAPPGGDVLAPGAPGIEVIALACGVPGAVGGLKFGKPFVQRPGVIDGQVQDQLDVAFLAKLAKLLQIVRAAEGRVNGIVVRHVVFVIRGRRKDRRQPDAFDPETPAGIGIAVIEIVHAVDDAAQVPRAVAVAVGERTDKDLVKDTVVVLTHKIRAQQRVCQAHFAALLLRRTLRGLGRAAAGKQREDKQQTEQKRESSFHRSDHLF